MAGESGKSLLTLFNDNIYLPVESFWSHFSRFTRWCTYWWILSITTRDGRPSSTNHKSFGIFQLCCPVARPQRETDSTCMYVHVLFLFFFLSLSRFLYSRVIRFDGLPGRALRRDSRVLGERKTRCLEVLCCSLPYTLRQFRRKVSSPVHYLWGRSAFDDDSNRFSIHIHASLGCVLQQEGVGRP